MYAAIDCGTNSVRLLIGDESCQPERHMTITRLGRGVDQTRVLDPAAIERTLAALREFRSIMDRYPITSVRATATSAARDASNRDHFFEPAQSIIGAPFELLSGRAEAELSYAGATYDLPPGVGRVLVVDIGGGSTEFALRRQHGDTSEVVGTSIDVGCVRMTERFLHSDPPAPDELSNALSVIDQYLDDVLIELPEISSVDSFVGLAGTVVTAAAVEIGLPAYDRNATHHFRLSKVAAEDVFRTLATESLADRIHNPGLEAERADVIVGGCCVLVAIMRKFGFAECIVSESDILDGLLQSQFGAQVNQ